MAKRAKGDLSSQLALCLRDLVELVPDPARCGACTESLACALHRRKAAALEVLREYDR